MPERRYKRDGKSCTRCWVNRLKHSCPQSQKFIKKHPEITNHFDLNNQSTNDDQNETRTQAMLKKIHNNVGYYEELVDPTDFAMRNRLYKLWKLWHLEAQINNMDVY